MSLQHPPEKHQPSSPAHKDPAAEFVRSREVNEGVANRLKALDEPAEQALPSKQRPRLPWGWVIAAGVVFLGIAGGLIYYLEFVRKADDLPDLEYQQASRGKLVLSVVEKGELEAAKNTDINCKVRSSGRGSNVATSIKWITDEGSRVKEGDVICRLDDSALKDAKKNQEIVVEEKKSALVTAQKDEEITKIQNETDVKTAENNYTITIIDLQKYVGEMLATEIAKWGEKDLDAFRLQGLAVFDHKKIKGELEKLAEDVEARFIQAEEKVKWSDRMLLLDYVSPAQNRTDRISRDNIQRERNQLLTHVARKEILDLIGKMKQAQANVEVAKKKLEGSMAQAKAKREAAESVLAAEKTKLSDLQEDIDNCTIKAPNEGMVVYHVDERNRFGGGNQNVIQVNESVKEGQKLMRIPDLRQMQVKVKVHEGLVSRLNEGLPAQVKIAGLDQPFRGSVKDVSAVASSTDWMSSDVKVYPTTVLIEHSIDTLKPQMSAEVTILVEELDSVLRVPVNAVLETNNRKFCYVKSNGGLEKRYLATGLNNTKFVEIKELDKAPEELRLKEGEKFGLKEGEWFVTNPRGLADKLGDLHSDAKDPGEGMHIDASKVVKKSRPENKDGDKTKRGGSRTGGGAGGPGAGGPGAGGPGAPGGGPGGPGGAGAGRPGGFQMSEEDRAKMEKQYSDLKDAMKKAKTPDERKKLFDKYFVDRQKEMKERGLDEGMLQQFLPRIKDALKKRLTDDGVEVPD
jgi:multidrug efflux pump subunit AcrA (membrane-fusion protein)